MRILFWSPLFHPYVGGIEVLGSHLVPALVERGHEVTVISAHGALDLPDDDDEWNGVTVHRRRFTEALASGEAGPVVELVAEVRRLRRAIRPDVVHLNLSDALGFFDLRTRAAHPAPTLVAVHITVGAGGPGSLLADLLGSADVVTAGSASSLDAAVAACPDIADRSRLILNGLPPDDRPATEPPSGPPVLVAAGRLVADKGFDVAIRALAEVRQRHPEAVLRLVGDGPERGALADLATGLGLADAVDLVGWVAPERLADALAPAHVVVMPSRWQEAFGLVALHGMQVGRPVVAAAVGGLPEVVDDGTTGLLVPPEDPAALAAAVVGLLDDPVRARRLGDAGRRRAEERFGFGPFVDAHVAIYEELVS